MKILVGFGKITCSYFRKISKLSAFDWMGVVFNHCFPDKTARNIIIYWLSIWNYEINFLHDLHVYKFEVQKIINKLEKFMEQ